MPLKTFADIVNKAKKLSTVTVAVAAAHDIDVLESVKKGLQHSIANFCLCGNRKKIEQMASEIGLSLKDIELIDASSDIEACFVAVRQVREGNADVVMKGMVQSSDFLRAVLNKESGLREKKVLSHVATFEVVGYDRLIHVTDPALNIAPTLEEKIDIIQNVIKYCHSLELENPKIAALAAVEVVSTKINATLDAAILAKMNDRGQIRGCTIDGPLGLDNAVSIEAAHHKKIYSDVAGLADVLLVPEINAGNILYKSMVYFAQSKIGAVVLGGTAPVILTSRADSSEAKMYSIALAVLQADFEKRAR